ncbi:histidine triad nucleotide-binding protein [Marinospirillum insulare]|uniref:Histidine triad nucleotide-binding protein n=1 Tax=Marinospirillum insulare TaxID=217169 RepID=A0ABQ5ZTH8_9GAMM|nr:histidine triad nucleotide-binding protein [Marinospirillum insulare]GLR62741.1 histidine triad nucleotide-binding protein [Marinospirillum insulare]
MQDCIFCKIAKHELPATVVFEDDQVIAFNDIDPKAPHHLLVIPKRHITTLNDLKDGDEALAGRLQVVAAKLAKELGFAEAGYRTVMNCNEDGGQTVWHIHMHVLAGRSLSWPPG